MSGNQFYCDKWRIEKTLLGVSITLSKRHWCPCFLSAGCIYPTVSIVSSRYRIISWNPQDRRSCSFPSINSQDRPSKSFPVSLISQSFGSPTGRRRHVKCYCDLRRTFEPQWLSGLKASKAKSPSNRTRVARCCDQKSQGQY